MALNQEKKQTEEPNKVAETLSERVRWWVLWRRIKLGELYYGTLGGRVTRIGPNTLIKWGHDIDAAEVEAMRFISERTMVPVPKVYDVQKRGKITYIRMEYIRGRVASLHWWRRLSPKQKAAFSTQLTDCIKQLREIPAPSPEGVSNTSGGPAYDHRFGVLPTGPYATHKAFHAFLRRNRDLVISSRSLPGWHSVVKTHQQSYASKFTHGDLAPRNVLVRGSRIVAIIDWDSAGWRPEYWEYTKAYFTPLGVQEEWFDAVRAATGEYPQELEGERHLWNCMDFPSSPGWSP